jgi:hypothetical protein
VLAVEQQVPFDKLRAGSHPRRASVRNDIAQGTSFGTAEAVPFPTFAPPVIRSVILIAAPRRCATQKHLALTFVFPPLPRGLRGCGPGIVKTRQGWAAAAWVDREFMRDMGHPIRVENSRPATVWDTARTLGISKKRTEEFISCREERYAGAEARLF